MADNVDRFYYVYSCDLDLNVQIKVGTLEGKREKPNYKELLDDPQLRFSGLYEDKCADLHVTCQIHADGKSLALPTSTSYKAFTTRWNWNEWLTLPVKYSDLPRNAQAAFTIWDVYNASEARPVGGTTVSLFGKQGMFRGGMHDLKVWPDQEADGSLNTKTPGKLGDSNNTMARLAKLTKKHHKGRMQKIDWLDRLTFRELEMINEREKKESNFMFLMVEFARVHYSNHDFSIVYYEKDAEEVVSIRHHADIVTVPDSEMLMENLVEAKHHTLVRSERSGLSDRDLKPNANTRDQLNNIMAYCPNKVLTSEEEDLIWRFRFYLTNHKQALTKFLKCVKWDIPREEIQGLELLSMWNPIDVADALELLSPLFTHPEVRRYAVSRLKQADDEELMLYLLQLVQALKYENFDEIKAGLERDEKKQNSHGEKENKPSVLLPHPLAETPDCPPPPTVAVYASQTSSLSLQVQEKEDEEFDLATFLIYRACKNYTLANYFYWYLIVEQDDQNSISKDSRIMQMYKTVMKRFAQKLNQGDSTYKSKYHLLIRQHQFTEAIVMVMRGVAKESGNRKKKIDRLQALLSTPDSTNKFCLASFDPLPLSLHPEIKIKGVIPEKASIFKSALFPAKLTLRTVDDKEYKVIAKTGDDLRQDQLILQMISLMDKLLQKENLDLKLTPYRVLATSSKTGFVQFIEAIGVADVLSTEGSILNFFRKHAPKEGAPYNISPDVMDTYIKSSAGYSVITYLLGIGDRHLDNLLLTTSGKLFHVDFGYILGRDPKPFPPPMKLSKELLEGMGGMNSEQYQDFTTLCYTAFLHLRRHANLFLNLFSLMVDANVPDIALEPDKTVKKLQDKFRLDLTDEEAVQYIKNLIDESAGAMFSAWMEQIHKFAQYWRR